VSTTRFIKSMKDTLTIDNMMKTWGPEAAAIRCRTEKGPRLGKLGGSRGPARLKLMEGAKLLDLG
jgi:hypothetical protein